MQSGPDDIVLVGAARTPIGKFRGGLATVPAPDLGGIAIAAALSRAGVPFDLVDEVIMGQVIQAGAGQAPARQASIAASLPYHVGATCINKVCGSGLKAVMMAAAALRAGDGHLYVAGGMENMNLAPYLLTNARFGYRLGHGQVVDAVVRDGLWCHFEDQHMGQAAEWIARRHAVSREEQDAHALLSHQRAIAAADRGELREEIVPVPLPDGRGGDHASLSCDENPRRDTSAQALASLHPVFQDHGTVTAGNSPGLSDGAAAVVVTTRGTALDLGVRPLARVIGYTQSAVEPKELFQAPVLAVNRLLSSLRMKLSDFDFFEINEAFASQIVANLRDLDLDIDRVNVNGGAIALGHPIGASGARILVTLCHALRARNRETGMASLCLGGGEAVVMALALE